MKDQTQPALPISFSDIEAAARVIKDAVLNTPAARSETLSALTGAEIVLKFEIFQFTASFKERGALNRLSALSDEERKRGVVAMSAGNHAQGVAYHANRLNIPTTIFMPEGTPFTKVRNTERLGATVVLSGETLSESSDAARIFEAETGAVFIHPFDDPLVMAGQGTLALEFLASFPDLDVLVVPIGGGGLISGIAVAARHINPKIKIIGVQTEAYPAMKAALEGREIRPTKVTIAEGIAVKMPGLLTREVVRALVDDILIVKESMIEDAIDALMEIEKVVVEGAGAAGLAAVLQFPDLFRGKKVGLPLCGGNIDPRTLSFCVMRGMVRDGRISRLKVTTLDLPGALARVTAIVGRIGANIVEVYHQRQFATAPVKYTEIELVVETKDRLHGERLIKALEEVGLEVTDTSGAMAMRG
ncbi:threonine ammonia-lyase [Iodidimonas nitroreducens]|uniref:Threonine ammonia-lyase n=1 Tax=Iodidimonas nitroreducens TaxID=1236968 RepID=A0A5A7N9V5_9PROT|nr:threonine ammonia-lyase [Iodidimonas nitroreducens]GAK32586.1 L-threonine dehydratase catabolic TdcB [alpha proteobacterium Q-1]GER04514.1 threonine ammonia-lyase [Iodidimonas nitroreducens]